MKQFLSFVMLFLSMSAFADVGIDNLVNKELAKKGVEASALCQDGEFLRRVSLNLTGRVPSVALAQSFIGSKDEKKREKLVDSLLNSNEYVEFMVLKWGDLLRNKSEFPSNIWPNGVQAYSRWMKEQVVNNVPYDKFVQNLLLCTGSNFRVPPVNFYRAFQDRQPDVIAANIALLFLGERKLDKNYAKFFTQLRYKSTNEWKEEIVYLDYDVQMATSAVTMSDGTKLSLVYGRDHRVPFVEWLTSKDNRKFAMCYVNRVWYWMMGQGIVNPVDDLSDDNLPSNRPLLDFLTDKFIASGYDSKELIRLIVTSNTFGRSSRSTEQNCNYQNLFAYYPTTRITAEQLVDAIGDLTGIFDIYTSSVPEPYSYYPHDMRTVQIVDGTVTSPVVELFGRPSRDVSLESDRSNKVSSKQVLYLLNSAQVINKIAGSKSIKNLAVSSSTVKELIDKLYLMTLTRHVTQKEVNQIIKVSGSNPNKVVFANNLLWALINSPEFIFNH